LYTVDSIIKNGASKERIALMIYIPIIKLYYNIVVKKHNDYHDEEVLKNLKRLISLHKEYLPYLTEPNIKLVLDYELTCYVDEKELEGLISIDEFIEQYK
jgi:hypothetical protein